MIELRNLAKRYPASQGPRWILDNLNLRLDAGQNVALIGGNGAGKSTLLGLIGGSVTPTRGEVIRGGRVSWPIGLSGGFQGSLSGRQNSRFICRVHGHGGEGLDARIERIARFADIGRAFDEPVRTYSSGMRARLAFALSVTYEFDWYLSDEITSVGDAVFRDRARRAFEDLAGRAGLIMASHDPGVLRSFCTRAVWLHRGQARCFDTVQDAWNEHRRAA